MHEGESRENPTRILGPICVGLLVSFIAMLVATLVATILLFIGWDWASYMHVVGLAIAFAGVGVGSIYAGFRAGARGWLVGLVCGGSFVVLCFLLSLAAGAKGLTPSLTIIRIAAACLTGCIGGSLGVNLSARS